MSINKAALDQASASRKRYRADTPTSLYSIEGEDAVFIAAYLEATKCAEQPDQCPKHGRYTGTNCTYCDWPPLVENPLYSILYAIHQHRTTKSLDAYAEEITSLLATRERESGDRLTVMNTALGVILNYRDVIPPHIVQWAESKVDLSDAEAIPDDDEQGRRG